MRRKERARERDNPKLDPKAPGNMQKEPGDWISGEDPMTAAQASYLKTLSEQAGEPEKFDLQLTKAEASRRIDELKGKVVERGPDKA